MAITAEQFKMKACKDILIPGFNVEDEPIEITIRTLSIMNMISRKSIPNPLMPAVEKLFKIGGAVSKEEAKEMAGENIEELIEFLTFICDTAMVEPSYSEVGEYLTQEQMLAIFNATQGTVNKLTPFRNK